VKTLESVEKDWTFQVVMLDQARNAYFKEQVAPLIAGGIVSVFLLIMVALGLVGVLWQNVTQRTKEIGLRRALGGDADNVSRQIHGEQFVITSLGVGAAAILLMQVPLLDLVSFIKPEIYFTSLAISVLVMYVVTHLCSLLPSWLAMDIQPAEALRYE
jgi:putative ABC transport system permease protein